MKATRERLLIVNQDVGYIFIDLANVAIDHYDEVVLMCGSMVELGGQLDPRVHVEKIPRYRRTSTFSRFVSWILGFFQIALRVRTRFRHHEVLASSNPPLNTLLPLICPNRTGLYVLDLYPEALFKTGMVSHSNVVVRLWHRFNRSAYPRFDWIWALSPSMKSTIEDSYSVAVGLVPAWASRMPQQGKKDFLAREGLSEAWIVLYSGNLGREHEIEAMLDCARILAGHKDLLFVIAGEGWKRDSLVRQVEEEQLHNVQFFSKLSASEFATLLSHARIGVVTQSLKTADVCIPSKTFNLLAQGLPILGIGERKSDFGNMIAKSQAGTVFLPNEVEQMCDFISSCLIDDAVLEGYEKGARLAAQFYTPANAKRLIGQFSSKDPNE